MKAAGRRRAKEAASWLLGYGGVRVLVTGASGFIGRHVWQYLSDAGSDLIVVGRSGAKLERIADQSGLSGLRIAVDLSDGVAIRALLEEVRPAIVFNAAGYGVGPAETDGRTNERINAELPAELAVQVGRDVRGWRGQQLVHIGSAFEYGSVAGEVKEETEAHPASPYGEMKLQGTRMLSRVREANGVRAVTARVCTVYGPGEHRHRLLPSLLRAGAARAPLDLTAGDQERDFTYVRDVAEGLLRIGLLAEAPPVLNLATGRTARVRDFATRAYTTAGGDASQLNFGALPYRSNEVWQGPVNVELLRDVTGWVASSSIDDGVRATYEALLRTGELTT
jgi:nucleoside-diphosphate-sugar epimerase